MATWFVRNADSWDQIILNLIPEGSNTPSLLAAQLGADGFVVDVTERDCYLTLDTSGSYDEYLSRLGSAKRRYFRKRLVNIEERLKIEHLAEGTAGYFQDFLEAYRGRRLDIGQSDPFGRMEPLAEFIKAIIPQYEAHGWLTLSMITLDGHVAAYCYCLKYEGVLSYYMPAFRDEYKGHAPGMLLVMALIRKAFETPSIVEFNFGRGDQRYKCWFKPSASRYLSISINNSHSLRMRSLRAIKWLRRLRDHANRLR